MPNQFYVLKIVQSYSGQQPTREITPTVPQNGNWSLNRLNTTLPLALLHVKFIIKLYGYYYYIKDVHVYCAGSCEVWICLIMHIYRNE